MRSFRLITIALIISLGGCYFPSQYFVITDTRTGHKYLAKGVLDDISGPGYRFTDDLTGKTVRVEAAKLEHITPEAYHDAELSGVAP